MSSRIKHRRGAGGHAIPGETSQSLLIYKSSLYEVIIWSNVKVTNNSVKYEAFVKLNLACTESRSSELVMVTYGLGNEAGMSAPEHQT